MADVTKNTDEGRFEIRVDGELAGFADYRVGEMGVVVLPHTEVDPAFQGQGLAGQLVGFALDDIRAEGYRVEPACSYVRMWIQRHPEYADLVADDTTVRAPDEDDVEDVTGVNPASDPRI